MSEPFIGEIRAFGFNFAPIGWLQCNGQLLPISNFDALFAVIGTTYGGDGQTTLALPNLQGQVPMHWGNGVTGLNTQIGQPQGQSTVTLTTGQLPQHSHAISAATFVKGSAGERSKTPTGTSFFSQPSGGLVYQNPTATPNTGFAGSAISPAGNSQPHENMQPYLVLNFCMATEGIFPQRT